MVAEDCNPGPAAAAAAAAVNSWILWIVVHARVTTAAMVGLTEF